MKPYGCHNREMLPGYWVKVRSFNLDGTYDMVDKFITHTMTTDCRYDKKELDERCEGCKHMC